MKTEHRCEICGFVSTNFEAVHRCEWLGRHNHFRIGQEVVFLHTMQGEQWELAGLITDVIFSPQNHKPLYTIFVPEEPKPDPYERNSSHFHVAEDKIIRLLPKPSDQPTE